MGQKTHPHGLRVGIHRKWNSTWFAQGGDYPQSLANQRHVEELLQNALQSYAYTKASGSTRLSLVDVRLFKQGMHRLYVFVFFYKFRSKRPPVSVKRINTGRSTSGSANNMRSSEKDAVLPLTKSWLNISSTHYGSTGKVTDVE
jgi:hypothetical protein